MIPWLEPGAPFPPVEQALAAPNGLLAASADISEARLLAAYRQGIFPWYSEGQPVLWWSPDPRMVLFTDELKISRSLRKSLRAAARDADIALWVDHDFIGTMQSCGEPRPGQDGTWITGDMVRAYAGLHQRGLAHSVEVWDCDTLVGGLYGVSLGRMFFGESMFSHQRDASKIALVALVGLLRREQVPVIDCQQKTSHLASLGAREIGRSEFCAQVAQAVEAPLPDWSRYASRPINELLVMD